MEYVINKNQNFYGSSGDESPSESVNQAVVNEIFASTSSLDSKGVFKLRRKELTQNIKEEKMKSFQYRKIRALYGTRPNQQIFPVDEEFEKKRSMTLDQDELNKC